MTTVTEQDVIALLECKVAALSAERDRIQATLAALAGLPSVAAAEPKPVQKAPKRKPMQRKPKETAPVAPPAPVFQPIEMLDEKIISLLSRRSVYTGDVVASIHALEPERDLQKVENEVMNTLFAFKRKGLVTVTQEGKKFKYSLA